MASPCLIDPRAEEPEGDQECIFSLVTRTKKLLSVTICDEYVEIESRTGQIDLGRTDISTRILKQWGDFQPGELLAPTAPSDPRLK